MKHHSVKRTQKKQMSLRKVLNRQQQILTTKKYKLMMQVGNMLLLMRHQLLMPLEWIMKESLLSHLLSL